MAITLLWCFCNGQAAPLARDLIKCPGTMFVYEIQGEGTIPGPVNFRNWIGPEEGHPFAHMLPDPRDVAVAGSA